MIQKIRHTGIVVEDLEISMRFYRDWLGFEVSKQAEESGTFIDAILGLEAVTVTTVKMTAPDGQLIELLKFHTHPKQHRSRSVCDIGIAHIAFTVSDVDCEYERLSRNGIPFFSRPQTSSDGFAKVAFCKAPEGTFVELVEELGP